MYKRIKMSLVIFTTALVLMETKLEPVRYSCQLAGEPDEQWFPQEFQK